MRILFADRKSGRVGVLPEVVDDLWVLEKVLERGDAVEADVMRTISLESGRKESVKVHVKIAVEDVEFHEYSRALRVKGKILEARPEEYVGKGRYQTVTIVPGRPFVLWKRVWRDGVLSLLREAEKETSRPTVAIVSMDDEEAVVALYSLRVRLVGRVRNKARGKRQAKDFSQFFGDLLAFTESLEPDLVIVGGPGFIYEEFIRFASERGKKRYVGVRTSVAGEKGVYEIIADRGLRILQEHRLGEIVSAVNEFLRRISKGEPAAAGEEAIKKAEEGAVDVLVVHERALRERRTEILSAMDAVKRMGGRVYIMPAEAEGAHIVEKLGGCIALLRY